MTITIPDFVARKMKKTQPQQRMASETRKVTAPFRLPPQSGADGQIVIKASGRIIAVRPEAELKRYRVNAQVFFKDLSRMVILQYISHRQSEIIKDLRILSEDLYNNKANHR